MPKNEDELANVASQVLVVDDDSSIRMLVTTILTREGFSVETARNGAEAIEAIGRNQYDAIILDLMMPNVDGFEVVEYLRRTEPKRHDRSVIILTAVVGRDLRELDGSPVFRVLRKPFELNDLIAAVADCVERHDE